METRVRSRAGRVLTDASDTQLAANVFYENKYNSEVQNWRRALATTPPMVASVKTAATTTTATTTATTTTTTTTAPLDETYISRYAYEATFFQTAWLGNYLRFQLCWWLNNKLANRHTRTHPHTSTAHMETPALAQNRPHHTQTQSLSPLARSH